MAYDLVLVRPMCTHRSVCLLTLVLGLVCSSPAGSPTVKVEYDAAEDVTCSKLPGGSIKEEWKAELLSREPEFIRLWEAEGPRLVAATAAISRDYFPSLATTA